MAAIDTNDVWICESDGFVGQISVLSNKNIDEPTVVSCNGVCTAQIVCLKAVPSFTSANCGMIYLLYNFDFETNIFV